MHRAVEALGGLDGLAVTAGPIQKQADLLALTDDDWAESFETQLMTVVRALRVAVPAMTERGGGSIVTVSAYSIRAPKPVLAHYAAMKAAVGVVTKTIAKAHGKDGIRANAVNADRIRSGLLTDEMVAARSKARGLSEADYMAGNLLKREVTAEDVADAFVYLATATKTTAAVVTVDGGNIEASMR